MYGRFNYGYCFLFFYLIFFTLQYFTSKKFFYYIDKIFLLFFAFSVFANNNIFFSEIFNVILLSLIFFVFFYALKFFIYKKNGKELFFDFKKLSAFLELLFIVSVFFCGINSAGALKTLYVACGDVLYQIVILSITVNLKKRFNMLRQK